MRALSRMLGLEVPTVWQYLRKGVNPSFKNLLHMCHTFSISPVEFLTTIAAPPYRGPQFVLDQLPTLPQTRGHAITEEDIRTYRLALEQVLALDDVVFPSLEQVVKKLGCSMETLKRHCADLCQAISTRHPGTWTEDTYTMAKLALENALKSSEPVPLKSVCKRIGWQPDVLKRHFPDLCESVVSRYQNRLDHRYQNRLLEELAKEGSTLSVTELARELGCERNTLRARFPDECDQLSKRYLLERQKGGQERMQRVFAELERIMVSLHQQNIYPSLGKVRRLLSNPDMMLNPEVRNRRREILKTLDDSL
jgi:transcriptional regulator with XRE-family HTH domain